jgi:putative exporter of polyketide antibiotics
MGQDFIFGHLPFWIVTYILALTAWACLGRFLMQALVPPDSANYIWRGFRFLTGWAVWLARRAVPSYVAASFLPLVAAFWLFALRMVLGIIMVSAGMAPRLVPPGGAG